MAWHLFSPPGLQTFWITGANGRPPDGDETDNSGLEKNADGGGDGDGGQQHGIAWHGIAWLTVTVTMTMVLQR